MAHRADGCEVVFHSKVHIAGAGKSTFPRVKFAVFIAVAALQIFFLEGAYHHIVVRFRETAALAEVADGEPSSQCLACFLATALLFQGSIVFLHITVENMGEFADARKQHHFPHNGGKPFAFHRNMKFAIFILADAHFGRIKPIAAQ